MLLVSGIIDGAFACKPRFFGIKNETDVIRLFEMDTNHDGNKVLLEENKVISLKRTENSFYLLVVLTQCACGMLFPFHIYWIHSDCVWHERRLRRGFRGEKINYAVELDAENNNGRLDIIWNEATKLVYYFCFLSMSLGKNIYIHICSATMVCIISWIWNSHERKIRILRKCEIG